MKIRKHSSRRYRINKRQVRRSKRSSFPSKRQSTRQVRRSKRSSFPSKRQSTRQVRRSKRSSFLNKRTTIKKDGGFISWLLKLFNKDRTVIPHTTYTNNSEPNESIVENRDSRRYETYTVNSVIPSNYENERSRVENERSRVDSSISPNQNEL